VSQCPASPLFRPEQSRFVDGLRCVTALHKAAKSKQGLCYNTLPFASYKSLGKETVPRIKSAIKRVEITERNRVRNRAWKSYVRSARNRVEEAAKSGQPDDTTKALNEAYAKIDRAVSKGILHRNTGARRKARLVAMVKRFATATPKAGGKGKSKSKKSAAS
jgi:small subunit ribosomal protein S20